MKKTIVLLAMVVGLSPPMYSHAQDSKDDVAPHPPCLPFVALGVPLEHMLPRQRIEAYIIINEFTPKVCELRRHITDKKGELEGLTFNRKTSPETLSRLGRDLQMLRDELHVLLTRANQQMMGATGITLGSPTSRGCGMDFE